MAVEDSAVDQVAACVQKVARTSQDSNTSIRTRLAQLEAALYAKKLDLNASNKQMKEWCRYLGVCACNCRCYYRGLRHVLRTRPRLIVNKRLLKDHPTLRCVMVDL